MTPRMPLNPDGSEISEEDKRRFIMQQQHLRGGMTPEMAARMPHLPGGGGRGRKAEGEGKTGSE